MPKNVSQLSKTMTQSFDTKTFHLLLEPAGTVLLPPYLGCLTGHHQVRGFL